MKIVISGGASGLGEAICRKLAEDKHEILITFCGSTENANSLQKELGVLIEKVDFSDLKTIETFCSLVDQFEPDVLVNNAIADVIWKHFHKIDPFLFCKSFEQNVFTTLRITQSSIKSFRRKKFGKIITILSSAIVNKPPIGWSSYVANKAYLESMSKSWATEYGKLNITANCISPAFMETPFNRSVDDRIIENMVAGHPLKRLLKVEEVAEVVAYFVNASQQINGINFLMNSAEDVI